MYRDKERYGQDPTKVIRTSPKTFNAALNWKDPKKIFTNSWSDFFIEEADQWREAAWSIIRNTPQHSWQILTKRPERIRECLPADWGKGYDNVWLGVSIENSDVSHDRLWRLIDVPAKVKFLSVEPMLGPVDLLLDTIVTGNLVESRIDWVIVGGESGNDNGKYKYRECKLEWIYDIIDQCKRSNTPVFVKQLGTHLSKEMKLVDRHGGDIEEWPQQLQIRQFPR